MWLFFHSGPPPHYLCLLSDNILLCLATAADGHPRRACIPRLLLETNALFTCVEAPRGVPVHSSSNQTNVRRQKPSCTEFSCWQLLPHCHFSRRRAEESFHLLKIINCNIIWLSVYQCPGDPALTLAITQMISLSPWKTPKWPVSYHEYQQSDPTLNRNNAQVTPFSPWNNTQSSLPEHHLGPPTHMLIYHSVQCEHHPVW